MLLTCTAPARLYVTSALALALPALAFATPARAEAATPAPAATGSGAEAGHPGADADQGLETIVVSAQKREENLQTVPLAIAAFSARKLAETNMTSLEDVSKLAPSLMIGEGTGQATTFIRGVGNPIRNIGDEASVPVFIDDVYYARLPAAMFELNNVRDVEVLEGPQGTLFGRNAEAGLLNVHTRDPGSHPVVDADVGYGSFETFRGHLYVATPLTDTLGVDLAGILVSQERGWGVDVTNGTKNGFENVGGLRGKLVWKPASRTEVRIAADYMNTRSSDGLSSRGYNGLPSYAFGTGTAKVPAVALPALGFYDVQGYYPNIAHEKGYTVSGEISQDLGFAKLTSISAFRRTDELVQQDGTNSPANLEVVYIKDYEAQFSQELRLNSQSSSKLKWQLGAYYLHLSGSYPPFTETGPALGGLTVNIASNIANRSYAGFGQADYEILPHLTITLGGRYTSDTVNGEGSEYYTFASTGAVYKTLIPQNSAQATFTRFTYKAAANYALSDAIHLYASASTGFKAGTFPSIPFSTTVVPPETLNNYEAGLRSEFLDHKLRFNLTAFYERVHNYQVQVVTESTATNAFSLAIASAPRVHSEGIEASAEAALTDALSIYGGITAMEAKYDTFENSPFYTTPSPYGAGYVLSSGSADGKYLARAPKVAFNMGGTWKFGTDMGLVALTANWKHTGTYYWDPDNFHAQGPVDLIDANMKLTGKQPMDRWWVQVWVKNLLNKAYYWGENEAAGATPGVVAPPRTFGITLGYKM